MTNQLSSTCHIAIAGSTKRTLQCARALHADDRFTISFILTPEPKVIGKTKVVTKNPLHLWAEEQHIPAMLVNKTISQQTKDELLPFENKVDLLLVVDFGYMVPDWLLAFPNLAPLNIHPSDLPRWRGSSPAQFALLYGDTTSAIALQRMVKKLDAGPIIAKLPFEVGETWTQSKYYDTAFALMTPKLADMMCDYWTHCESGELAESPQDDAAQTPIARRLTKEDSFVGWPLVRSLMISATPPSDSLIEANLSTLLQEVQRQPGSATAVVLERASRAFSPWPTLWTLVPTKKGEKRMKIYGCSIHDQKLILGRVQFEGQQTAPWNSVKNIVEEQ